MILLVLLYGSSHASSKPPELYLKTNHSGSINALTFNADGSLLASASADNTIKLWWAASGELLRTLSYHQADIFSVAFSPDGKKLASAGYDRLIVIWDIKSGQVDRVLPQHNLPVTAVAFSPDGKMLAAADRGGQIKVYNTEDGTLRRLIDQTPISVSDLLFSPDSKHIITGDTKGNLRVWRLSDGFSMQKVKAHEGGITSLSQSPGTNQFTSVGRDGTINIWSNIDWSHSLKLASIGRRINAVSFCQHGRQVVCAIDSRIQLWDVSQKRLVHEFPEQPAALQSLAMSPNGGTFATGDAQGTIKIWRASAGTLALRIPAQSQNINSVSFSTDGTRLVSGHQDGSLSIWNIEEGLRLRMIQAHAQEVWDVAYAPQGGLIASVGLDGLVKTWDSDDLGAAKTFAGHTGPVFSVSFSPDGKFMITAGQDQTIKMWNVETGDLVKTLSGHLARVWDAQYNANGKFIASASDDYSIRIWNANTGDIVQILTGHTALVRSVLFGPYGWRVASASADKSIKAWDLNTSGILRSLEGHTSSVKAIAFSKTRNQLASGGFDNDIQIWDWSNGELRHSFRGHANDINALSFSPDEKQLASASSDGSIRVWDTSTGKTRLIFSVLPDRNWICYSPEAVFFAGSDDADRFVGLRFDDDISAGYPVAPFAKELKVTSLATALARKPPKMTREIIAQRATPASDYNLWLTTFGLLAVGGMSSLLLLRRRKLTQSQLTTFFSKAGYKNVQTVAAHAVFLESKDKMQGVALELKNGFAGSSQTLTQFVQKKKRKTKEDLKLYLIYENEKALLAQIVKFRSELHGIAIPVHSTAISRSLNQNRCRETLEEIEQHYINRPDPFSEAGPIHDARLFFGRKELLERLPAELETGRHVRLLGLQKTGLTSIAFRVRNAYQSSRVIYLNCKQLPASAEAYFDAFLNNLEPNRGTESSVEAIRSQVLKLHRASGPGSRPFVIILDGLNAFAADADKKDQYTKVMTTLAALATDHNAITLLITDNQSPENPDENLAATAFFPNIHTERVGMLRRGNSDTMFRALGALNGINWVEDAIQQTYALCGGHPFVSRLFASQVSQRGHLKTIDVHAVTETAESIQAEILQHKIGVYFQEGIWHHLSKAERSILTTISAKKNGSFQQYELPAGIKKALPALENYGLIANDVGRLSLVSQLFKAWLRAKRFGDSV